MEKEIFARILTSKDVFYKHQQVGDDELTEDQRSELLKDCFENKKTIFLQRYEKYINESELSLFEGLIDQTSLFLLERIRNRKKDKRNMKNRRFMAMQRMKRDGDYFTDEKMREREPFLYDVMVGRFLDEQEKLSLRPSVSRENEGWSGMLQRFEDSQEIAARRRIQKEENEGVHDTNPAKEKMKRFFAHINNKDDEFDMDDEAIELGEMRDELQQISQEDAEALGDELDGNKEQLRQEFEAFMMEKFLAGKDSKFFDYNPVDSDEKLDESDRIRERDDEEKWFDED